MMARPWSFLTLGRLADGATLVVAVVALVLGVRALTSESNDPLDPSQVMAREDREVEHWSEVYAAPHSLGADSASVVVVEFGDYECPYCRRAARQFHAVWDAYSNHVTYVFRHYPLQSHPNARRAAGLAECAGEQARFWEAHDFLMRAISLDEVTPAVLTDALDIPDPEAFATCIESSLPQERISRDVLAAQELGIRGVPTFIVNGLLLGQTPDSIRWHQIFQEALDEPLLQDRR